MSVNYQQGCFIAGLLPSLPEIHYSYYVFVLHFVASYILESQGTLCSWGKFLDFYTRDLWFNTSWLQIDFFSSFFHCLSPQTKVSSLCMGYHTSRMDQL
jgi:hypothetical protein